MNHREMLCILQPGICQKVDIENGFNGKIYALMSKKGEIFLLKPFFPVQAIVLASGYLRCYTGYEWIGWKVINEEGTVIYVLDTEACSIAFPYGVDDYYIVKAVFEKVVSEISDPEFEDIGLLEIAGEEPDSEESVIAEEEPAEEPDIEESVIAEEEPAEGPESEESVIAGEESAEEPESEESVIVEDESIENSVAEEL